MPFKSEKQRKWMWANEPEMAKHWSKEETVMPKIKEFFSLRETPTANLATQMKTATPVTAAKITQQAQSALKNQQQTLQGVAKTQGATVKMGKTDVNNPIANVFVTKPDGSADVMDATSGQLKPVPGVGQGKPTDPLQNAGVMGTK